MVIWFGSYHLRKKRQVFDRDTCTICGQPNRPLRSYTAFELGHAYWIPLMPWGRARIARSCLTCKRLHKFAPKGRRLREAIEMTREDALAGVGGDVDLAMGFVAQLAHLGDFEGVDQLLSAWGERDPSVRALGGARFLGLTGDADAAVAAFEGALKKDPVRGAVHYWFGRYLLVLGRDEEAVAQLARAAEASPAYDDLGLLADLSVARECDKDWHGMAVLLDEIVRRRVEVLDDRSFARRYAKACRKAGREPRQPVA